MKHKLPSILRHPLSWVTARCERRRAVTPAWALRFLTERGFNPQPDADGNLLFRVNSMKYVLHLSERYFELHVGFARKRTELNEEVMARVAQEVMVSTRMVKIHLRPDALLFSIECLQHRRSEFAEFFDAYIRILRYSVTEHTRRYNEAAEELRQQMRRREEEEELTRRFALYRDKDVVN